MFTLKMASAMCAETLDDFNIRHFSSRKSEALIYIEFQRRKSMGESEKLVNIRIICVQFPRFCI